MITLSVLKIFILSICVSLCFISAYFILNTNSINFRRLCKRYEYLHKVGIAKKIVGIKSKEYYQYGSVSSNMVRNMTSSFVTKDKYSYSNIDLYNEDVYEIFCDDIKYITKLVKRNEAFFYMLAKYECFSHKSIFSFLDKDFESTKLTIEYYKELLLTKNLSEEDKLIIDKIEVKLFNNQYKKSENDVEMRIYRNKQNKKSSVSISIKDEKPHLQDENPNLQDEKYDDTIEIINKYISQKKEIHFDGKSWRKK